MTPEPGPGAADPAATAGRVRPPARELVLRALAAAGLAVGTYVHLDLAANYDGNAAAISQGSLFRIEAVLTAVAALLVLLVRSRAAALVAFLVAAGALAAVLVYRYVDVGALGPLPAMYEPVWSAEKIFSAIGEAVAALAALLLLVSASRSSASRSSVSRSPVSRSPHRDRRP